MYEKIITHNDFDGVVSAAICSHVFKIEHIFFAGPSTISRAQISITTRDIVCDLPYPLECGLWFDHHEGNYQELLYRKIDPSTIEGKFDLKPSCARVVYEYFLEKSTLPEHFIAQVAEADIIDAFDYQDIQDWRKETPGKIIDASIRIKSDTPQDKNQYLRKLVLWLRNHPLEDIARRQEVREKYTAFRQEENEIMQKIEQNAVFLPEDADREIVFLDFTNYTRRPFIIKNLSYLLFPDSMAVVEIQNLYQRGIKSNDLGISMSLSLNLNQRDHRKDVGEIMRQLNIGDGHAGAAGGTVYCSSKNEMLKQKDEISKSIFSIWQKQV